MIGSVDVLGGTGPVLSWKYIFVCVGGRGDTGTMRSAKSEESLSSLHATDSKSDAAALFTI